jgi:hypothetical protein
MKCSLRSLMMVMMLAPPLLAWGWWGWQRLHPPKPPELTLSLPWLDCPDYAEDGESDALSYGGGGGRMNFPHDYHIEGIPEDGRRSISSALGSNPPKP